MANVDEPVLYNTHYQAFFRKREGKFIHMTPDFARARGFRDHDDAYAVLRSVRFANEKANAWEIGVPAVSATGFDPEETCLGLVVRCPDFCERCGNTGSLEDGSPCPFCQTRANTPCEGDSIANCTTDELEDEFGTPLPQGWMRGVYGELGGRRR